MHAQDLAQSFENARERLADNLGIVTQADRTRADDVREEDGDDPPFLRDGGSLGA